VRISSGENRGGITDLVREKLLSAATAIFATGQDRAVDACNRIGHNRHTEHNTEPCWNVYGHGFTTLGSNWRTAP
jgi:hypothetical protein